MKTIFLFTVDVESRSHGDPRQDIFGQLPCQAGIHGIERMMDLLESYQVRGTFFLNVYEVAKYGEEDLARAARAIHDRGHDLELHTHPQPMYRYYGMSSAPFDDQVAMLQKGVALIEGWTGKRVVAHRAGAFLGNGDTLRALQVAGLKVDSSLAPGSHDLVPLVSELGASNLVRRIGDFWEIPVTFYEQVRIGRWSSRRILDIEASSLAEIKRVIRTAMKQRLPTVCLLMHSFSFTRHGYPDERIVRKMAALLKWLRHQDGVEIGTIERAYRSLAVAGLPELAPESPLRTGIWLTWARALQSWNDGWKNFAVAAAGIAGLALLILLAGFLLGRVLMAY